MNWQERITVDPNVCHSKACIRDARVIVSVVSDSLTVLECPNNIARVFGMTHEHVEPVRHYGAERCGRSCEEHQNE